MECKAYHRRQLLVAAQAGICVLVYAYPDQYRIVQWLKEYSWINTIAVITQFTDSPPVVMDGALVWAMG